MKSLTINLYDDNAMTFIGTRRVYGSGNAQYIRFNRNHWYLSELVQLCDTDYALPEGRLYEI